MPRHIVRATDLAPHELRLLFETALKYKKTKYNTLEGRMVSLLFYEPSTRTIDSFESAAMRLGMDVLKTPGMMQYSSAAKGEILEDTIQTEACYSDCIVLRHPEEGAAERAAKVSPVPLINAGDGTNEHPTQAYTDLYTLWSAVRFGRIPKEFRILFFGDNTRSRTVRSLAQLLVKYSESFGFRVSRMDFYGPEPIGSPSPALTQCIIDGDMPCAIHPEAHPPARFSFDVVYVTRAQWNHAHPGEEEPKTMTFTQDMVNQLPQDALIMHPLPRNEELPQALDTGRRLWCFEQVQNGLYVRMALLEHLLRKR